MIAPVLLTPSEQVNLSPGAPLLAGGIHRRQNVTSGSLIGMEGGRRVTSGAVSGEAAVS